MPSVFSKISRPSEFHSSEIYNRERLEKLVKAELSSIKHDNDDEKKFNIQKCLKDILKNLDKNNTLYKIYKQKENSPRSYYLKDSSYGILYLPNCIRSYLCGEFYHDLDQKNCHVVILKYLFDKFSLVSKELNEYIENRDSILKKESIKKEDFLSMINNKNFLSNSTYMTNIHNIIYNRLIPLLKNDDLYKDVFEKSDRKKNNQEGCFISKVLQDFEQDITRLAIDFVISKNIKIGCIIYDGFHISKEIDIQELEKYILEKIEIPMKFSYKKFDDSKIIKLLDEQNSKEMNIDDYEKWKLKWEKNWFFMKLTDEYICEFYQDMKFYKSSLELWSKTKENPDFMEIIKEHPDPENPNITFFNYWINDPNKRSYHKFDFLPRPLECSENIYNIWKGFAYEYYKIEEDIKEDHMINSFVINTFIEFIKHAGSYSEKSYNFLMAHLAYIIQYPGIKNGISYIFNGQEGTIKGTLSRLIQNLIGSEFFLCASDANTVFARFNENLLKSIVIFFDEAVPIKMLENEGPLKHMITDSSQDIEIKGGKKYTITSCSKIFITTNMENPAKLTGSRRFVVEKASPMSDELRININKVINNKDYIAIIFNYLMSYKIPYYINDQDMWSKNRPITEAYQDIRKHFIKLEHSWLIELSDNYEGKIVSSSTLFEMYKEYMNSNNVKEGDYKRMGSRQFYLFLAKIELREERLNGIRSKKIDKNVIKNYLVKNKYCEISDFNIDVDFRELFS